MSFTEPRAQPIPATTYTPVSVFGGLLCQAMQPWLTLHLAWLLDGIGVMVDPLYNLVADIGVDGDRDYLPGYGRVFNVAPQPGQPGYGLPTCDPADLPYVGQYVGVSIPQGTDPVTARSLVVAEAGQKRGTPAAVIAAAKRNLVGTQSVQYIERKYSDGSANAGWFGLIVKPAEVVSLPALIAAVNAVKFGGLMFWVQQSNGTVWNAESSTYNSDTLTWAQKG